MRPSTLKPTTIRVVFEVDMPRMHYRRPLMTPLESVKHSYMKALDELAQGMRTMADRIDGLRWRTVSRLTPEKIDRDPSPDSQNPEKNHSKNKGQKP